MYQHHNNVDMRIRICEFMKTIYAHSEFKKSQEIPKLTNLFSKYVLNEYDRKRMIIK